MRVDGERLRLTNHAKRVMKRRGLRMREVAWVLAQPEQTWSTWNRGSHLTTFQRGPMSVVLSDDMCVITVLLRRQQHWTDDDAKELTGRG